MLAYTGRPSASRWREAGVPESAPRSFQRRWAACDRSAISLIACERVCGIPRWSDDRDRYMDIGSLVAPSPRINRAASLDTTARLWSRRPMNDERAAAIERYIRSSLLVDRDRALGLETPRVGVGASS